MDPPFFRLVFSLNTPMNLTEIAKKTYRERNPDRRPGSTFAIFDKKQRKYYKTFMAGEHWKDRHEDANFYDSAKKAHDSLNGILNKNFPSKSDVWPAYYEEIGLPNDQIDWHHITPYFEIHEIVLTAKVQRKIEIGTEGDNI